MSMTELPTDWLIGYYALGRDKFCTKTISINKFSSERVDAKGLYGRWRLRVMGLLTLFIDQSAFSNFALYVITTLNESSTNTD